MQFMDGSKLEFHSNNNTWYDGHSIPIRMNDIHVGEWYDAAKQTDGWLMPYNNYSKSNGDGLQQILSTFILLVNCEQFYDKEFNKII